MASNNLGFVASLLLAGIASAQTAHNWGVGASLPPTHYFTSISTGYHHSLGLTTTGKVIAWGSSEYGETLVPQDLADVIQVAAGSQHSVALTQSGTVVVWGNPFSGNRNVPEGAVNIKAIAASSGHTLALRTDGRVYSWGAGGAEFHTVPSSVQGRTIAISAGKSHNMALLVDGTVVAWGSNSYGETSVPSGLRNVIAISAGYGFSLALLGNGTVVGWGNPSRINVPVELTISGAAIAISAGEAHSVAIRANGSLIGWGDNSVGQLNLPSGLSNVIEISAQGLQTAALSSTASIEHYLDGYHTPANVFTGSYKAVAVDLDMIAGLRADGTVMCVGLNLPSGLSGVKAISASGRNLHLLKSDGSLLTFNSSGSTSVPGPFKQIAAYGQLVAALEADGGIYDNNWIDTSGLTMTEVAVGNGGLLLVLRVDGSVGRRRVFISDYGQYDIDGLENVRKIFAGGYSTAAIRGDGTTRGYGIITYSQTVFYPNPFKPLTMTLKSPGAVSDSAIFVTSEGRLDWFGTNNGYAGYVPPVDRVLAVDKESALNFAILRSGDVRVPVSIDASFTPSGSPVGPIKFGATGSGCVSSVNYTTPHTFQMKPDTACYITPEDPVADPPAGVQYRRVGWSDNDPILITRPVESPLYPVSLTATYRATSFLLTVQASNPAAGTVTGNNTWIAPGGVVNITATANPGFSFAGWSGTGVAGPTNPSTTVTVNQPQTVVANFQANSSLTVAPATGTLGQSATLSATVGPPGAIFTGTLQFQVNGQNAGTAVPVNGAGTYTLAYNIPSSTPGGDYTINATLIPSNNMTATPTSATGTLTVRKITATVYFDPDRQYRTTQYTGTPRTIWSATLPADLPLTITYNGAPQAIDAGTYAVVATVDSPFYEGSATSTMYVDRARADLTITAVTFTYDGTPKTVVGGVWGTVAGQRVRIDDPIFTYFPGSTTEAPTNAGSYPVSASWPGNQNFLPITASSATLTINPAQITITMESFINTRYDGSPKTVTATSSLPEVPLTITYNGVPNPPVNAGTYTVRASSANPNYSGSNSATLAIQKAFPTVSVSGGTFIYSGQMILSTCTVTGVMGENLTGGVITYNGTAGPNTGPINVGSYSVVCHFSNDNYHETSGNNTITVQKATATITFVPSTTSAVYDGVPKPVQVTTSPANLPVRIMYNAVNEAAPANAGSYSLSATLLDTSNFNALTVGGTLVITKATPTLSVTGGTYVFDGTPKSATGSVTGVGGASLGTPAFAYNPGGATPVNAGVYAVTASYAESANYVAASGTATITITKVASVINLVGGVFTYDGAPKSATASVTGIGGTSPGAPVLTYNPGGTAPVNTGTYSVSAVYAETLNYSAASATASITINPAIATLAIDPVTLNQIADPAGVTPRLVRVITNPANIQTVTVAYSTGMIPPVTPGVYSVAVSLVNPNYVATPVTANMVLSAPPPPANTPQTFNAGPTTVSTAFSQVSTTQPTDASTTVTPIPVAQAGALPSTFSVAGQNLAFQVVSTVAVPQGSFYYFCIATSPITDSNGNLLRILHGESVTDVNGVTTTQLVDRTVLDAPVPAPVDANGNPLPDADTPYRPNRTQGRLCAKTTSFSPFLLATINDNQAPALSNVALSQTVVPAGTIVNLTASVSDLATGNSNILRTQYSLDGGNTWQNIREFYGSSTANITFPLNPGTGAYNVCFRASDAAQNSSTSCLGLLAVFHRNGTANGSGWMTSPAGAYLPNTQLSGRATISTSVRYNSGSGAPTGDNSFQLGTFTLASRSIDWLVVNGKTARYQGVGTINGTGDFGFLITVVDGSPDRFRIRIWDRTLGSGLTNDGLVYDNQPTAPILGNAATPVGGGNLTVR